MPDIGKTTPDPVDVHVGAFIRRRRKLLGVSQQGLADKLQLTFQQVQKYERGVNRISASKLWAACELLGCDPGEAFEGLTRGERPTAKLDPVQTFAGCPGALEIAEAYPQLGMPMRAAVLAVVRGGVSVGGKVAA